MSDGFTEMLDRAQAFYGDLARNNSKDWFEPRKEAWKRDIEAPAKLLAEIMAEELSRLTGDAHTGKVFRINRDVRFSKDKSPYKTMLAMLWSSGDADSLAPAFYFGIEPDRTFVGCGTPGFDKEGLTRYRAMVDRWGDRLTEIIDASGGHLAEIGPEPLKRVPKPYDPDHIHGDLLRRKSLALGLPLAEGWRESGEGVVAALTERFELLMPFRRFLAERL
ncbi:DUF2461 domain-containing protein [Jannaschia seohaensis]|uniref:TIGR02453 family protein n=1 Tax=Jannaschia seohaensis TaxID=475081 RepID=A0A2Y9A3W0_9RHOB|nr:DUF2461 domain-containing protein [Jannaschia seohaensis]PWJ22278.1 uncharacterized protein (TIGR02453 family) [Jannaschia seohaensis]SSA38556.1 TIGR02453 family protein [Jannaschia seohaensis]